MFSGILSNIQSLIISANQQLTLSPYARTGLCCNENGTHRSLTGKGEYSFFKFILKNYAQVTFEKDPSTLKAIKFAILELQYGSTLIGRSLNITANEVILHPGATLKLQGGGYKSELGHGAGRMVYFLI